MAGRRSAGWVLVIVGALAGAAGFFIAGFQIHLWIVGGILLISGLVLLFTSKVLRDLGVDEVQMPSMRGAVDSLGASARYMNQQTRLSRLQREGVKARIKIIEQGPTGEFFNNDPLYSFEVDVMPEGLPGYRVEGYQQFVSRVMLPRIKPGATFVGYADRETPEEIYITWSEF